MASMTIKSIAAEAAPTDTPPFLPMCTYRSSTVPADTHQPVGAALAAIEPEPAAKAAQSPHQDASQLPPVTIKSIAAEAAPTDTPPFLPMRTYRRPTIPADTHDPVGAALAAIAPEPPAKAALYALARPRRPDGVRDNQKHRG